jgi:hypothetical protein
MKGEGRWQPQVLLSLYPSSWLIFFWCLIILVTALMMQEWYLCVCSDFSLFMMLALKMATAICAEALEERQTTWFKPRS